MKKQLTLFYEITIQQKPSQHWKTQIIEKNTFFPRGYIYNVLYSNLHVAVIFNNSKIELYYSLFISFYEN